MRYVYTSKDAISSEVIDDRMPLAHVKCMLSTLVNLEKTNLTHGFRQACKKKSYPTKERKQTMSTDVVLIQEKEYKRCGCMIRVTKMTGTDNFSTLYVSYWHSDSMSADFQKSKHHRMPHPHDCW
ncbi:hypothetical protein L1887_25210 [Cichorium endivia]|nr:hypothetical protein L1887_25210 [Cichorium endivia]